MIRNAAVLFGALVVAVMAMQPVLWVTHPGANGRSAREVGGIVVLHAISALPSLVAAITFAAVAAWGLKTRGHRQAVWIVVTSAVVLKIVSIRYVAPDVMAWTFVLAEIVLIAAFAFLTFRLVRRTARSSESAV